MNEPVESPETYDASKYERSSVTVDVVIFSLIERELHVLLVQRSRWPYDGFWAIPGGFINMDESLADAARRELEEETGVRDVYLEQMPPVGVIALVLIVATILLLLILGPMRKVLDPIATKLTTPLAPLALFIVGVFGIGGLLSIVLAPPTAARTGGGAISGQTLERATGFSSPFRMPHFSSVPT